MTRQEALAFLEWLRDDNFTFLGMREYTYTGSGKNATVQRGKGAGLGILSDPDVRVLRFGKDAVTTTPEIIEFPRWPGFSDRHKGQCEVGHPPSRLYGLCRHQAV